jgi:hypothetical protein
MGHIGAYPVLTGVLILALVGGIAAGIWYVVVALFY